MNIWDSELAGIVDRLVALGMPFAFFRRPGETDVHWVIQTSGTAVCLHTLEALDTCQGYVMAPFDLNGGKPVVVIRPDCVTREGLEELLCTAGTPMPERRDGKADCPDGPKEGVHDAWPDAVYAGCMERFLAALRGGDFQKLVLSRRETLRCPESVSAGKAFQQACIQYRDSYAYVCHTQQGLWTGATPEILLASGGSGWHTMALAGTQSLEHGKLPAVWRVKNCEEQACVAEYIRGLLRTCCRGWHENGPYAVQAGTLAHLRTDFSFKLQEGCSPADLLERLHPTPAVCGMPKEAARSFIRDNENYDRAYYSGFAGCWNVGGRTDLYVNLRCMRIEHCRVDLYAGGGILPSSELVDEWRETVKKMQTMKALVMNDSPMDCES